MIHIPALRLGKLYKSLATVKLVHHVTGDSVAEISQINGSQIVRDISRMGEARAELQAISMAKMVAMVKEAGRIFASENLPCGSESQSFEDYIRCLSATTGSPMVFCKRNAGKVEFVLRNIDTILAGLTRGINLEILDAGHGTMDGRTLCFSPTCESFGAILPSNSPGVHSLWVPAIALKIPLVLKPGREEPWTPNRVLQALLKAGIPPMALNLCPADHAGAGEILRGAGRSMLFGDSSTTDPYRNDHRVEIHGPGFSKILLGEDQADNWRNYLDLMLESIAANGGRSCINVSGIWTPRHGKAIAQALGERLAQVQARAWDDPKAELAAFANPDVAERISAMADNLLQTPGAVDVTEKIRGSSRLVREGRCAWLLPTIVNCDTQHPLANKEFLFPYASVVECPQSDMLKIIGPTLVATALTQDQVFRKDLMNSKYIDRINLGPIPSTRLTWDQPHEGNLFTHLYRQRAFQQSSF
ncbi:MAG: aldehyde dehydrogenase family protein [Gemmataceae bacterium]|nr:aldehyde dehydrogenase family protein [Gemmataceae bacterium]